MTGVLCVAAVAADQRWGTGQWSVPAVTVGLAAAVATAAIWALRNTGGLLNSALEVDHRADLRDRVSSAWEFLNAGRLDEPRMVQVRDAVRWVQRLEFRSLFHMRMPRTVPALLAVLVALALSFFIPPSPDARPVKAAIDPHKLHQLEELRDLEKDLRKETAQEDKELQEVLERLKLVQEKYDKNEMPERDMMLELARLEEQLAASAAQMGVENLAKEAAEIAPHLMANEASREIAEAVKAARMKQAAERMEALGQKVADGELNQQQAQKLARNMGVAAQKLGAKKTNSFSGDLARASEALKKGNGSSFQNAANSMSGKFRQVGKYNQMMRMRRQLGAGRARLGRRTAACPACGGKGCALCGGSGKQPGERNGQGQGQSNSQKPGGLRAGTGSAQPFGEPSRLADSYRKMMQVSGAMGDGPVDSEIEMTDGTAPGGAREASEVYSEYAAAAEKAIEQEEVPLSHRFHVKRYFEAIRPPE